jgi:phospholipid/cholesterol/gamma-HCH transport system substrate-binding protein
MGTVTRGAGLLLAAGLVPALVGCGVYPPDQLPLPGLAGRGDGAYTITIDLPDAQNVVQNQDVRLQDVVVGNIDRLEFVDWHARATVRIDGGTRLPANTTARVAQKSLLGAEFVELEAPPADKADARLLGDGDAIPLASAGSYPETEEVLAALSTVLNGGGLNQLKTINNELALALHGHEGDAKQLIHTLSDFVGTLDGRKADIVRAIDSLDRLSTRLNQDPDVVARAVDTIPAGLAELEGQRRDLVDALVAVDRLGTVARGVIREDKGDLVDNLEQLEPTLRKLADSGNNLTDSISGILTPPFPTNSTYPTVIRGDYGNLFAVFDVQPINLLRNFGALPPGLGVAAPLVAGLPPLGAGQQAGNPLTTPFGKVPGSTAVPEAEAPKLLRPATGDGLLPERGRAKDEPRKSEGPGLLGSLHGGR